MTTSKFTLPAGASRGSAETGWPGGEIQVAESIPASQPRRRRIALLAHPLTWGRTYLGGWLRLGKRASAVRSRRERQPEELLEREIARNAETWKALGRLGFTEGSELRLTFVYQTSGETAARRLAEHLRSVRGFDVQVEPGGVTGRTAPMAIDPLTLDRWVTEMLRSGHHHGGAVFSGWTATVSARSEARR